jgi:hypothetical protein
MADALTILLFVAAGEGSDATTRAMLRATREALGPTAKVEVRETPNELTEDEALIAEQLAGASAVVDLTWGDPAHRSAMLRVHVARSGRWIGRSIGFMASDASTERGRTIGFTVVSMLPEAGAEPTAPSESPSAPPAATEPPPTPQKPGPVEPDRSVHQAGAPAVPGELPSKPSFFAVDLLALAALSMGGEGAGGGGGGVAGYWFPLSRFSVRIGASLRAGSIGLVPSSTLTGAVSVGAGWHPLRATPSHPLGLSVRVDYLALYQSLQPTGYAVGTGNGAAASLADRWLSGIGEVVDLSWLLSAELEALVGLGLEEASGSTYVQVQGAPAIASFPPVRALGEAGLRVRF